MSRFLSSWLPIFSFPLCLLVGLMALAAFPTAGRADDDAAPAEGAVLHIQPPPGFVDASTISDDLPREIQANAVPDGVLLKVYLPDADAQRYAEKRPDAVTRQVALYGVNNKARHPMDKKGLELTARALEGAFAGYKTVPEETFRNAQALHEALRAASDAGTPVLVASVHTDNAVGYVTQIPFVSGPDTAVTAVMATALVLVDDRLVFVTASSFVTDNAPADHAVWAKSTAESFADMLVSANKN